MSIGDTDAIWWERICKWLAGNGNRHLIVYRHSMPPRGLLEVDYKIEERKAKQGITRFSKLSDAEKRQIESRIHITGNNMFDALKNAATKSALASMYAKETTGSFYKPINGDKQKVTV